MEKEKQERKLNITPLPNGPYYVQDKDFEGLKNSKGDLIPTRQKVVLCRCGGSSNKPFCDGTHAKIGFSSERKTDKDIHKRDDYVGKKITIHDNRNICAHAGFCTDTLKSVFRLKQEPWIDPHGAEAEAIIETVKKCPSGALSYSVDGVEHRDQEREQVITVTKDGPYQITGRVELTDASGLQPPSLEHYSLCRCGASKNKPFCDGSHWVVGFKDDKN